MIKIIDPADNFKKLNIIWTSAKYNISPIKSTNKLYPELKERYPGSTLYILSTPFLDRHNDCIMFHARTHNENWLFTDNGDICNDIEENGILIRKNQNIYDKILHLCKIYGIRWFPDFQLIMESSDKLLFQSHVSKLIPYIQGLILISNLDLKDYVGDKS